MPPSLINLSGRSYDDVALALLKNYPTVFLKPTEATLSDSERKKKVRSLATTIGLINKGKGAWWSSRKEATKCLAKELGINPDELGLDQKHGPHIFQFNEFPGLSFLDLKREDYWPTAKPRLKTAKPKLTPVSNSGRRYVSSQETLDHWLTEDGSSFFRSKKIEFLWVKDTLEFELLWRKLAAVSRHEVLSCKTLTDLFTKDQDIGRLGAYKPLIISVQSGVTVEELQKLIECRQQAPLLVISRFTFPPLPPTSKNDDENNGKPLQPNYWILDRPLDWRGCLLKWVEQRLNERQVDTHFSWESIQRWLDKFDPNYQWFICIGDVLTLCALASNESEKKLNRLPVGEEGMALLELLFQHQELDYALALDLLKARWKSFDISWEGDLPMENWKAIANGTCTLEKLSSANLISKGANGWNFPHPIVVRLALRDVLIKQVSKGSLESWAPACFDIERMHLVDAALDAVSIDSLIAVARQLEVEQNLMVKIGVAEALFMAVGRRIARLPGTSKLETIPNDVLMLIADQIFERLDIPIPWSRPINFQDLPRPCSRPVKSPKEVIEWVSVCWAWSLYPLENIPLEARSCLFPGWITDFPENSPHWLMQLDGAFNRGDSHWNDLLSVADKWWASYQKIPKFPENFQLPIFLKIGLLRRAATVTGTWDVDGWWGQLIDTPWAEEAVLHELEKISDVSLKNVAKNWWPSLVSFHRDEVANNSNKYIYEMPKSSSILDWAMDKLDADRGKALDQLDEENRKFVIRYPGLLKPSFKLELLSQLAQKLPLGWVDPRRGDVQEFFTRFGADAVDALHMFLGDQILGFQAAQDLWNWDPEKAKHLLQHGKELDITAKRNLIEACTAANIGVAIEVLKNCEDIFSTSERNDWAKKWLPNSRHHAPQLVQMITVFRLIAASE